MSETGEKKRERDEEQADGDEVKKSRMSTVDTEFNADTVAHLNEFRDAISRRWVTKMATDKDIVDQMESIVDEMKQLLDGADISRRIAKLEDLNASSNKLNNYDEINAAIDSKANKVAGLMANDVYANAEKRCVSRSRLATHGHSPTTILRTEPEENSVYWVTDADGKKHEVGTRVYVKSLDATKEEDERILAERPKKLQNANLVRAYLAQSTQTKQNFDQLRTKIAEVSASLRNTKGDLDYLLHCIK